MAKGVKTKGLVGVALTFTKPIIWVIDRVGEVDVVSDHLGQLGPFLNSGWGTLATVLGGCALIAWAVYQRIYEKPSEASEGDSAKIANSGALAGRDNTGTQTVYQAPVQHIHNYAPAQQPGLSKVPEVLNRALESRQQLDPLRQAFDERRLEGYRAILKGRLSDLKLTVGEGGKFFGTRTFNSATRRTYFIRCENVSRDNALTKCKVTLNNIATQTEYVGPWIIEEGFDLAPGDHKYIPLVSYGEPRYPTNVGESFMQILPAGPGSPLPSSNSAHVLEFRATGINTGPYDFRCKIWVEGGQLRIAEFTAPPGTSADLSFQEAAQIAFERAEKDGWLENVAGTTGDPAERLNIFKYMMVVEVTEGKIVLKGSKPPSRQSYPIPKEDLRHLHPMKGENTLHEGSPAGQVAYKDVAISAADLEKVIQTYARSDEPKQAETNKADQREAVRHRVAELITEGTGIRNEATDHYNPFSTQELIGWSGRVIAWHRVVLDTIKSVSPADAEWYRTLNEVPAPAIPMAEPPEGADDDAIQLYAMHNYRLKKLEQLVSGEKGSLLVR